MVFRRQVFREAREVVFVAAETVNQKNGLAFAAFEIRCRPTAHFDMFELNARTAAFERGKYGEHFSGEEEIEDRQRGDEGGHPEQDFFAHGYLQF